ncbi:SIS domain-containing protein [Christensenellaceae bacterium OttesenSCG-928-M15]|nr:SIS domain-containing protein [Christensenellaceae bacterium OttesenSCG-928-M15]
MLDIAWEKANEAFEIEADAVLQARAKIDRLQFGRAVDVLSRAQRIGVSGCGHSGIACMHFAHSLCCIERPARFLSPAEAVHGATGFLQQGDVMLLASRGGKTSELLPILSICKQKKVTLIGITENRQSPLALETDIALFMHVTRETDRYNMQGTTSFVVLSAIFDALQTALVEETHYQSEQFALVHPGGAVGERLNDGKSL